MAMGRGLGELVKDKDPPGFTSDEAIPVRTPFSTRGMTTQAPPRAQYPTLPQEIEVRFPVT